MIARIFPVLTIGLFLILNHASGQGALTELKKLSETKDLKRGSISFYAHELSTSKTILNYNGTKLLIPASNQKLLTTAAALSLLGPDYTFKTYLEYDGHISNKGVLDGNIYIRGEGDPTFGSGRISASEAWSEVLNKICKILSEAGIKQINGGIIGDASWFEYNSIPDYWIWTDIGNYYGTGAYGVNVNENTYKLILKPGKAIGDSVEVLGTDPVIPNIQFLNSLKTAAEGTGDNGYIYGAPFTSLRTVSGTIPKGGNFSIKGSMPDPAYFVASGIKEALFKNNIEVTQPARSIYTFNGQAIAERKVVHTFTSSPLRDIIKETNVNSLNLYAESLLKMIGKKLYNEGSTKAGIKALQEFWNSKGLDPSSIVVIDGSGLSTFNWVCSEAFSQALLQMSKEKYYADFYNSLPVSGGSGTLKKVGKGTKLENNMRAKSGSMKRVLCYSGYIKNPETGKEYSFSVMVNNFECTASALIPKLEKILLLLQAGQFN
ncbi:D-alanyl-D-alanine carboxypeptidase/D-alanyl-D-alanine endopeptidase [Sporocytophaga myxococcoides]|uniref:D-alanyl-D-alanine carboxypeptidase/D-alanyl-D-alanine endopeptidase n=1 Tax=Sporocytophaga myxococcoides TaxID=153721 RepID=UPI000418D078|nr:D-alanyl-D-alanine carboxypeptidase/D-alanyl-D-alanine-endopeptidase [Sporocytophaga myxococcoides]